MDVEGSLIRLLESNREAKVPGFLVASVARCTCSGWGLRGVRMVDW